MLRRSLCIAVLTMMACAGASARDVDHPVTPMTATTQPTGERCRFGCSLGEVCIRTLRGESREEHCDVLVDDCASPQVLDARKELAEARHELARAQELFDMHAASASDRAAAEDREKEAEARAAKAEYESVPRCNARCSELACRDARCVAASGVIECVAR